jgi:hypothetical protein
MSAETQGSVIDPAEAQARVDAFLAQTEQAAIDAGAEAGGVYATDLTGSGTETDHTALLGLDATISADNDDLGRDLAEGARARKAARAARANIDGNSPAEGSIDAAGDDFSEPDGVVERIKERFGYRDWLDGQFGGYTEEQWDKLSPEAQYEARIASIDASRQATQAELEASDGESDQGTDTPLDNDLEEDPRVIAGRESLKASTGPTEGASTDERPAGAAAVVDEFGFPDFERPHDDPNRVRPISRVVRDAVRSANSRRKAAAAERASNSQTSQETGTDRTIPYDAGLDSAFSQAQWDDMTFSEQYDARQRVHDANREVLSDSGVNPEPVTNTSKVSMRERASRIFVAAGEGLQRLREKGPTELIRNGWARAGVISNNALNSTAERARNMRSGRREAGRDNSEQGNRVKIILGTAIGAILVGGAVYIAKHGVESPVHLPDMGDALHPRVGRGGNNHVVGEAMGRRSGTVMDKLSELTPKQIRALDSPEFARLTARGEKLHQFVRELRPNWSDAKVDQAANRLLADELNRL